MKSLHSFSGPFCWRRGCRRHGRHRRSAATGHGRQGTAADMTDAEVRKVDKENKKITLKHGPIKSLDMPPMTMVFQVNDAALLDKVQPGDKVRFAAQRRRQADGHRDTAGEDLAAGRDCWARMPRHLLRTAATDTVRHDCSR